MKCIPSFNHNPFIRRHSLKPLSISSSLVCSVGKTSLWCRAENWTRACLTASRRTAKWAAPHHSEPRRTILSHAAPSLEYSTNAYRLEFVICMLSTIYCKSQAESTRNKKAVRGTRDFQRNQRSTNKSRSLKEPSTFWRTRFHQRNQIRRTRCHQGIRGQQRNKRPSLQGNKRQTEEQETIREPEVKRGNQRTSEETEAIRKTGANKGTTRHKMNQKPAEEPKATKGTKDHQRQQRPSGNQRPNWEPDSIRGARIHQRNKMPSGNHSPWEEPEAIRGTRDHQEIRGRGTRDRQETRSQQRNKRPSGNQRPTEE